MRFALKGRLVIDPLKTTQHEVYNFESGEFPDGWEAHNMIVALEGDILEETLTKDVAMKKHAAKSKRFAEIRRRGGRMFEPVARASTTEIVTPTGGAGSGDDLDDNGGVLPSSTAGMISFRTAFITPIPTTFFCQILVYE